MVGYVGNEPSPIDRGWLDTGDLGFSVGQRLFVTGRSKDVLIRHGSKIHPHDLEYSAQKVQGLNREGSLPSLT